jgi:hypothetical protein
MCLNEDGGQHDVDEAEKRDAKIEGIAGLKLCCLSVVKRYEKNCVYGVAGASCEDSI